MEDEVDPYQQELIQEERKEERPKSGFLRFIIDVLETIVLSVFLFLVINSVSARIRVDGFSMEPSLHSGEFVIVNKLAYRFGSPKIGEVVVFHFPIDPDQEYIKRVIGLPGDQVVIEDQDVRVNDRILDEPYIAAPPIYDGSWMVTDQSLFVLGDNRNNSSDSHDWGLVPMENVVGKAVFVYWPPTELGLIEHYEPTGQMP